MRQRKRVAKMLRWTGIVGILVLLGSSAHATELVLEAEVLEASAAIALPSPQPVQVRYALLHHKRPQDQPRLSAWLRHHASPHITFQTLDGVQHQAVLERLTHCFGRGLLLYTDAIPLATKAVIILHLPLAAEP